MMTWFRKVLTAILTVAVVTLVIWAWHWGIDRWFEPLGGRGLGDRAVIMILGGFIAFFSSMLVGLGLFVLGFAIGFVWFQVDGLLSFTVDKWRTWWARRRPPHPSTAPAPRGLGPWAWHDGRWVHADMLPKPKKKKKR